MSTLKQLLKAAKAALERNDPETVLEYVADILEVDKTNFFAYIFEGKAHVLQEAFDKATRSFRKATELDPENVLGWKGIFQVAKARNDYELYFESITSIIQIEIDRGNGIGELLKDMTNYLESNSYRTNLQLQELYYRSIIPGTKLGDILGDELGNGDFKLIQLIDIVTKKFDDLNLRNLAKERVKFGKNITYDQQLSLNNVTWTIYKDCDLDNLYSQLLNISNDDATRSKYQDEYLKYKYQMLRVAPNKLKLINEVQDMVEGMILIESKSSFAWNLYFNWSDFKSLGDMDINKIIFYLQNFRSEGLAQILYGYIMCDISPFDKDKILKETLAMNSFLEPSQIDEVEKELALATLTDTVDDSKNMSLSLDQINALLIEGYIKSKNSVLANRIICNYHIHLQEYGEGSIKCHNSIRILADIQRNFGLDLANTKEDLLCALAITYTYYEAPRNFSRALQLYDRILETAKDNVRAKIGKGLILIEKNELNNAKNLLGEVIKEYPNNYEALKEYSWCLIKLGDYETGRRGLIDALNNVTGGDLNSADTRATIHWRIAKSYIMENDSLENNIAAAYNHLIKALKETSNHAPSYTLLGILYKEYYGDKNRGSKCFYKAFELDVNEVNAAKYLVEELAAKNEWDVVEILCNKIITTESSKRILLSKNYDTGDDRAWPYRVLGCSSLNKQDDAKAVEWFQTALRMSSTDVQCWIGLGEAYYNCGRLDAASKVFYHVLTLKTDDWITIYMLGKILFEMGEFDEGLEHLHTALIKKPNEECILTAIYEANMGLASKLAEQGYIGRAIAANASAIQYILRAKLVNYKSPTLWKSLMECLRVYLTIQNDLLKMPIATIKEIFETVDFSEGGDYFKEIENDAIEINVDNAIETFETGNYIKSILYFMVLSAKAGILYLPNKINKYVRSIAFYNLGLSFLELLYQEESEETARKLSIKNLKRAVQLENNNPSFWVALGNAYVSSNPQIAQHCFIKATTLESRDASIWTNLAALYLRYGDAEIAQEAFLRGQSVAPQQSQSWLGNALSAEALGDEEQASRLFTHAYIVSNGGSPLAQLLYGLSIIKKHNEGSDPRDTAAAQEFSAANFALQKYLQYYPQDEQGLRIGLSISERCKNFIYAKEIAIKLCDLLEKQYETTESEVTLEKFAEAKTQLGRIYLALEQYDEAIEAAEFALNLNEENDSIVLSSRIVIGLGLFFNDKFDESLDVLTKILERYNNSNRMVVLIAQVLNAYGTEDTKQEALDQLFAFIEAHGSNLLVVLVLGAISIVDNLEDYFEAIKDELKGLSLEDTINDSFKVVPKLLSELNTRLNRDDLIWQRQAMLFPGDYHIWGKLSNSMTLALAELRQSKVTSDQLSDSYLKSGCLRNVQRSLFLNPANTCAQDTLINLSINV